MKSHQERLTERKSEEETSRLASEDDGNEDQEEISRTVLSPSEKFSAVPEAQPDRCIY
jgi:hypothetical protein